MRRERLPLSAPAHTASRTETQFPTLHRKEQTPLSTPEISPQSSLPIVPEGEEKCTVPDLERDVNMKRALPVDHPLTLPSQTFYGHPGPPSAHPLNQKEHRFHISTGLPGGFLKEDPGEHGDHFFWKERTSEICGPVFQALASYRGRSWPSIAARSRPFLFHQARQYRTHHLGLLRALWGDRPGVPVKMGAEEDPSRS